MELDEQPAQGRGRMVVGTDGTVASTVAVRWAIDAAQRAGSWLDVVLVWTPAIDFGWLGAAPLHGWRAEPVSEGHALVDAVVAEACGRPDPAMVRTFVMEGDPAECLLQHADGADVLVLGDRGNGAFLGLRLGSVTSTCALRPTCPVLVVPWGGHGSPGPFWIAGGRRALCLADTAAGSA